MASGKGGGGGFRAVAEGGRRDHRKSGSLFKVNNAQSAQALRFECVQLSFGKWHEQRRRLGLGGGGGVTEGGGTGSAHCEVCCLRYRCVSYRIDKAPQ